MIDNDNRQPNQVQQAEIQLKSTRDPSSNGTVISALVPDVVIQAIGPQVVQMVVQGIASRAAEEAYQKVGQEIVDRLVKRLMRVAELV